MYVPGYSKKLIVLKCMFCCEFPAMDKPDGPDELSRDILQELREAEVRFCERVEICLINLIS